MNRIITRIKREISVFQELNRRTKLLLVCIGLFTLGTSFLDVFLNIYLWREFNDLRAVALFNLCFFLSMPFGFIFNGLLLGRIPHASAFRFGILVQGFFPLLIISLGGNVLPYLVPLGLIRGFGEAFYWANLNLFIFDITSDKIRGYFTGLQEALNSAIWMVGPPLVGLTIVIVGQERLGLSVRGSYYLSFSIATFIFLLAVIIAGKLKTDKEKLDFSLRGLSLKSLGKNWWTVRLMSIIDGFPNGIFILTWSVLAFEFFGGEVGVGWFNGLLGMTGVLAGYFAGRLARPERRLIAATAGTVIFVVGTLFFGLNFSLLAFYLLGILVAIGDLFVWTVEYPVILKEMEKGHLTRKKRYYYLVDQETFLNLGRMMGLTMFILLSSFFAFALVYRMMFIIIALSSIFLLLTIRKLIKAK
jgi:YQGE family putative transporter